MSKMSDATMSLMSMTTVFLDAAVQCVDAVFKKKCDRCDDWDVVERLSGQFDLILTIGCANRNYQGILTVGINRDAIRAFVGEAIGEFEARDIFGEFANNYCAVLMDRPQFNARFGIMHQSLPVLYTNGQPFLPFISGVEGKVFIGNSWLYCGFAVQKTHIAANLQ